MLKLCEDIDTLAMMMLDGELAAQEQRDVELHVLDCAACKAHVERERAALELRRRRLAAPPAPALLRARIQRSLDEADRARRPAARRYLLPGVATFAAVAALALFVVGFQGPVKKQTGERAGATILPPEVQRVEAPGFLLDGQPSDLVFQGAGRELLNPKVAQMYYWAGIPGGKRHDVQVLVVDAHGTKVPAFRQRIGRYEVWNGPQEPTVMVLDGDRVMVLGSSSLSARSLVMLVGESDLIARIAADDPR
jgi:Putative zinc-finger